MSMATPIQLPTPLTTLGIRKSPSCSTLTNSIEIKKSGSVIFHPDGKLTTKKETNGLGAHLTRNKSVFFGTYTTGLEKNGPGSYSWGDAGDRNYFLGDFEKNVVSGSARVLSERNINAVSFLFYAEGVVKDGALDLSRDNSITIITGTRDSMKKYTMELKSITVQQFKEKFSAFKTCFIGYLMGKTQNLQDISDFVNQSTIKCEPISLEEATVYKKEWSTAFNPIIQNLDRTGQLLSEIPSIPDA